MGDGGQPAQRTSDARPPGRGWWATAAIFAGAALGLSLLGQRTLHGMDSDYFVVWLEQGNRDYPRHLAYLHLCGAIHGLIGPLGGSAFRALLLASALGSAVGLACLHRAGRLLLGERAGHWLWLGALATPAWLYYGTCAEIPGVFAGGVGLAWWAYARWLAQPAAGRAALLGLATAAAAALHSIGHLLPVLFLVAAGLLRVRPPRAAVHVLLLALVHGAVSLLLGRLLGPGAGGQAQDAIAHLQERWSTFAPGTAPEVFLREWLGPFLPWSALGLAAVLVGSARRWSLVTIGGLLLHLPPTVLLLGHHGIHEQGAYLFALLPPAVLATATLLPGRAIAVLALAGAVLGVVQLAPHWRDPVPPDFGAGVVALRAEQPFLLVVGHRNELDGARTMVTGLLCVEVHRALGEFLWEHERGTTLAAWFDGWVARMEGAGSPVLLSDSARRVLEQGRGLPLEGFWLQHVARRYRVVPVQRLGFRGTWVRPR